MARHSRRKDGVASLAYVPAISIRLARAPLSGMRRSSPRMTAEMVGHSNTPEYARIGVEYLVQ